MAKTNMANSNLALRVSEIEAKLEQLTQQVASQAKKPDVPWWEKIWGTFANDPYYDEAMELGRKYRESLRPKATKRRKAKPSKKSNG